MHFLNASWLWFIVDNFFLCRVRIIRRERWNYEKLAADLGQLLRDVAVDVIRKYGRRCLRLIYICDQGAKGRFAAFINKKPPQSAGGTGERDSDPGVANKENDL